MGQNRARYILKKVRQVAVPAGRQTTTVFGRVDHNAAPGAKSAIHDCLVRFVVALKYVILTALAELSTELVAIVILGLNGTRWGYQLC